MAMPYRTPGILARLAQGIVIIQSMKAPGSQGFGVAQERTFADLARAGEHDHRVILAGLAEIVGQPAGEKYFRRE